MFSFTATVFLAQSNIATVRDDVIGPFGDAIGFTNTARSVAVTMPSAAFFTLFGSTYTGLPTDVFPISFHFAWLASGGVATRAPSPKVRGAITCGQSRLSSFGCRPGSNYRPDRKLCDTMHHAGNESMKFASAP